MADEQQDAPENGFETVQSHLLKFAVMHRGDDPNEVMFQLKDGRQFRFGICRWFDGDEGRYSETVDFGEASKSRWED